jgi:hypothetical protein
MALKLKKHPRLPYNIQDALDFVVIIKENVNVLQYSRLMPKYFNKYVFLITGHILVEQIRDWNLCTITFIVWYSTT